MATERFQEGSIPSFKISFGEWPGPEPIFGDIHVDLGSGNSPQHREKYSDLADLHGGSVRNVGDKLWADFSSQRDAKNFVRDSKVFLQLALPDKEFEEVNSLASEYGLKFVPLPLRHPVVSLVEETGEEKSFSYAAVGKYNNMALFESLEDSYDFKNWTNLDEVPLDKQREVVSSVRDFLNNPSNGLSVPVDTVKFPEWALGSLMNGDNSGLSDEEISQIENFQDEYKGYLFVPREDSPSFERTPVIGQAADCVSLDIINITTLSELRMQKQMADFRDATGIALEVKDGHPFYPGILILQGKKVERLPDNFLVNDSLDLSRTPIEHLPENLAVKGDLVLTGTRIRALPDNFKVGGAIYAHDSALESLPDNLVVNGNLHLDNTPIEHLPANLRVDGNLYLMGSKVESLPANLKVKTLWLQDGRHTLNHSPRTPDGYIDLRAAGVPIDKPRMNEAELSPLIKRQMADFEAATGIQLSNKDGHPYYNGNLDLGQSKVRELPDGLEVNGFLSVIDSKVERLPENLVVRRYLDASFSKITELPDSLVVNGGLGLGYTHVSRLPDDLTVNEWLDLEHTDVASLPEKLTVNGSIYLEGSKVRELPRDLRAINLHMDGHTVEGTPDILTRGGYIDLYKADLPIVQVPREQLSPMMQQYVDFKRTYPNIVPLFHVGDSYETYYKDADRVAKAMRMPVERSMHVAPDGDLSHFITVSRGDFWKLDNQLMANRIAYLVLEDANNLKKSEAQDGRTLATDVRREAVLEQSNGKTEERAYSFHR